jgi:glycosyltransferase involved in cell wall biosynthesis
MISVVIPTLNAGAHLAATLAALVPAAVDALVKEVVVADGGSNDDTLAIAEDAGGRVIPAERGRGRQLAAGCAAARGEWLLALHADTRLSPDCRRRRRGTCASVRGQAGWFRFRLDDSALVARLWEQGVALRCAVAGAPYGDQGLLLPRALYEAVGGYPPWSLMEDVEFVRRLGAPDFAPLAADALNSAGALSSRRLRASNAAQLGAPSPLAPGRGPRAAGPRLWLGRR